MVATLASTVRWVRVLLAGLMLAAALAGCGPRLPSGSGGAPATSSTARNPAGAAAPSKLIGEVRRELAAMRTTHYQHSTDVDETAGVFDYDCSGLLDYALGRALPSDASALPTTTSVRPLAGDIERYLRGGQVGPVAGWRTVSRVDELRPGDVVSWLATEDSTTGDTGHVMIVLAAPKRNDARHSEWLVEVADSTLSPHAADSRHKGISGLGTGTIGLITDDGGAPTAFYWQGGVSKTPKPTEIALGRPQ